jgi:XTP/dITP diphosphohydrolase
VGSPGRLVLLVTSPRLPAGLLTATAWDLVRSAPVFAATETPQVAALRSTGVTVTLLPGTPGDQARALLAALATAPTVSPAEPAAVEPAAAEPAGEAAAGEAAAGGAGPGGPAVVWLAGPGGDEEVAREVGRLLVGAAEPAELELVYGSWDPPGARLLDVVAVMDRLRVECPWDADQTHRTLAPYLLEETYEAYDAIEAGVATELREELGDVLLQVAFHARVAQDAPADADRFAIDDVAAGLVDKLVRRHPHVFAGLDVSGAGEVHSNWEKIKRAEKSRTSAVDGIALSQPALSLAAKLLSRADRAGVTAPPEPPPAGVAAVLPAATAGEAELGATLLALVAAARDRDLDPEAALRRAALAHAGRIRTAEATGGTEGED